MGTVLKFKEWPDVSITPMKPKEDFSVGRYTTAKKKCGALASWQDAGGSTAMGDAANRGLALHGAIEHYYAGTYKPGDTFHYEHKDRDGLETLWTLDVVLTQEMADLIPPVDDIVATEDRILLKIPGIPKKLHGVIDAMEEDEVLEWKSGKVYPEHVDQVRVNMMLTDTKKARIFYLDLLKVVKVEGAATPGEIVDGWKKLKAAIPERGKHCGYCALKAFCPAWNATSVLADRVIEAKLKAETLKGWKKEIADLQTVANAEYESLRVKALMDLKDDMHKSSVGLGSLSKKTETGLRVLSETVEAEHPADKNPDLYDFEFQPKGDATDELQAELKKIRAKLEEKYPRKEFPGQWQEIFNPSQEWIAKNSREARPDEAGKITVTLSKSIERPKISDKLNLTEEVEKTIKAAHA